MYPLTLDLVRAELEAGRTCYVHCWGGIGRTGTARLTVEEYNGKKRNKVAAWIVGTAKPAQPQAPRRNDNEPF